MTPDDAVNQHQATAPHPPKSWYCDQCHVEVYERRCPHCGKLKRDPK